MSIGQLMSKGVLKEAGVIGFVVLVAAIATFFLHSKAPNLYEVNALVENEITLREARQLEGGITWIDARTDKDFSQGHVEGALLLNQEYWADLMWKHREVIEGIEGTPVIVYCDGKRCRRSGEVAERLRTELGLSSVYVLKGDWREL